MMALQVENGTMRWGRRNLLGVFAESVEVLVLAGWASGYF